MCKYFKNIWSKFNMIYQTDISPASLRVPWVRNLPCPPQYLGYLFWGPAPRRGSVHVIRRKGKMDTTTSSSHCLTCPSSLPPHLPNVVPLPFFTHFLLAPQNLPSFLSPYPFPCSRIWLGKCVCSTVGPHLWNEAPESAFAMRTIPEARR